MNQDIKISDILPVKRNLRRARIDAFKSVIKEGKYQGIEQVIFQNGKTYVARDPITVKKHGEKYRLIDGAIRIQAFKELGNLTILCRVIE